MDRSLDVVRSPRPASLDDREAIEALAAQSFRAMATAAYDPALVAACLPFVVRIDPRLLGFGRYWVLDDPSDIVAAGGWSPMDEHGWTPAAAAGLTAQIRALWVHPGRARQGLGRRLMAAIESDARAAGHRGMGVRSSLNAVPFYGALGYVARAPSVVSLADGVALPAMLMAKTLA